MEGRGNISTKQTSESQQLTKELFESIIQSQENNTSVEIIDINITPATNRGDNYASMVYAIEVVTSINKYNFISKLMPNDPARKHVINIVQVFVKEISFYGTVIPIFNRFLKGRDIEDFLAIPKCYYGFSDCDKDIIILENLRTLGFSMADRRSGLQLKHVEACVEELGKLHAVSLALKKCDPQTFEIIKEIGNETQFTTYFQNTFHTYAKANAERHLQILRESATANIYVDDVQRLCDNYFENIMKLVRPSEPHSVLCHGDCWTNNIMFKYADDEKVTVESVVLLDFQLIRYGSPVLDLAYFLYNCTSGTLRRAHLQHILEHYHSSLSTALTSLGCDPSLFTFEAFQKEWKNYSLFGFYAALFTLQIVLAKGDELPDLDATTSEKGDKFNVAKQDLLKERFVEVVLELGESGILNSA